MPIVDCFQSLICHTEYKGNHQDCNRIVIGALTDKEERKLDNKEPIIVYFGSRNIKITSANLICYGDVDFSTNSSDYKQVARLIKNDDIVIHIPANYNYDLHCAFSPIKSYQTTETTNISKIVQYFHGRLGKPKKIIIFKEHIVI